MTHQTPAQSSHYRRAQAVNARLLKEYAIDARKPWDEFVDELLDVVDNGAFNSVYEPKHRVS